MSIEHRRIQPNEFETILVAVAIARIAGVNMVTYSKLSDMVVAAEEDQTRGLPGARLLTRMDMLDIYDGRVDKLYDGAAKGNAALAFCLVRAIDEKIITPEQLNHAIDNNGAGLDVDDCYRKLKAKLGPRFHVTAEIAEMPGPSFS